MGKIDDMRRQREQQFDLQERRAKARPPEAPKPNAAPAVASSPASPTPPASPASPTPRAGARSKASREDADVELAQPSRPTRPTAAKKTTSSKSGGAVSEQGKCPVCKKTKPVSNGVLAQHQKGFGKACAGSRRAPL